MQTAKLLLLVVIAAPRAAYSQNSDFSPIVLLWGAGMRNSAMANASVTPRDDEAVFYNPAEIGAPRPISDPRMPLTTVHSAGISWQRTGNATLHALGAVFETGALGIGLGARHLGFEDSELPLSLSHVGEKGMNSASSIAFTAGVARLEKGVRVGISATYAEDRLSGQVSAHTTFDVGIAQALTFFATPFMASPGPFHLGLAVQNIGQSSVINGRRINAPLMITAGAGLESFPHRSLDISGNVSLSVRRDGRWIPRTGWELAWAWLDRYAIAARAGLRRPEYRKQSPVTFGVGLMRDNVSIHYAFEPGVDTHARHQVGLRHQ